MILDSSRRHVWKRRSTVATRAFFGVVAGWALGEVSAVAASPTPASSAAPAVIIRPASAMLYGVPFANYAVAPVALTSCDVRFNGRRGTDAKYVATLRIVNRRSYRIANVEAAYQLTTYGRGSVPSGIIGGTRHVDTGPFKAYEYRTIVLHDDGLSVANSLDAMYCGIGAVESTAGKRIEYPPPTQWQVENINL